jgi:hypothetical protein
VAALSLLKHFLAGSPGARSAAAAGGAVAMLRLLWPPASTASGSPLFHEALGLLASLLPACAEARRRVAVEGSTAGAGAADEGAAGTLLGGLLGALFGGGGAGAVRGYNVRRTGYWPCALLAANERFRAGEPRSPPPPSKTRSAVPRVPDRFPQASQPLDGPTFSLALQPLLAMSACEDGAAALLRSPFPGQCMRALRDALDASSGYGAPRSRAARDPQRPAALLQVPRRVHPPAHCTPRARAPTQHTSTQPHS